MAAAVGSMYEEKLSPVKGKDPKESEILKKEEILKNNVQVPTYNNESSSKEKDGDAVLDEIAAKVDALGFNETDPNHMKCMDTVKSQGDTINTLINQLRIMFEEYTNMQHERDYFEELNEALFRCLELSEGATVLESDDAEENAGENSGENSGETAAESSAKAADEGLKDTKEAEQTTAEDVQMEEPTNEENGEENKTEAEKRKTTMKSEELLGINELLRREIFELRHEVEVLKETFRDYLNSEELSQESTEEDTEDDEAHMLECAQCRGDGYPGMESEDYQYLENDKVEIVDESDSD